jgi:hypothetical protein
MRAVIVSASLAALVLAASPAWAQKPKGKSPAGKPKPAPVATRVVVANSVPGPLAVSGVIHLTRGTIWAVVAGLQSGMKSLPPNLSRRRAPLVRPLPRGQGPDPSGTAAGEFVVASP